MLGLRDLDVWGAGRDDAPEISSVFGLEELRLPASDDRERRARGLDQSDRIDPAEFLPEMRIEA